MESNQLRSRSRSRSRSFDRNRRKRRDSSRSQDRRHYKSIERHSHSSRSRSQETRIRTDQSQSPSPPKTITRENVLINEKQIVNEHLNEIALHTALIIEYHAKEEVKRYLSSEDYKVFLEDLKRRERQRLLDEVSHEIAKEKAALLQAERIKMQIEINQQIEIERIPLLNKLKMEEYQRQKYQEKLQADAERLVEIERKAAARIAQELKAQQEAAAAAAEEERIRQLAHDKEEEQQQQLQLQGHTTTTTR
eukprot:gene3106-3402_t